MLCLHFCIRRKDYELNSMLYNFNFEVFTGFWCLYRSFKYICNQNQKTKNKIELNEKETKYSYCYSLLERTRYNYSNIKLFF